MIQAHVFSTNTTEFDHSADINHMPPKTNNIKLKSVRACWWTPLTGFTSKRQNGTNQSKLYGRIRQQVYRCGSDTGGRRFGSQSLFTFKIILQGGEDVTNDGHTPGTPQDFLPLHPAHVVHVRVVLGEAEDPARVTREEKVKGAK